MKASLASQLGPVKWHYRDIKTRPELLRALWGVIQEYSGNPLLLDFLTGLIDAYNVPARDPIALARAIQVYSAEHIKFFRERPERFVSPLRTIVWGLGDCDDKTILVASSLRTFRIPVRLVDLLLRSKGQYYGHVYNEAFLSGAWVPLESVRLYPWGHNPALIAKERGLLVKINVFGDPADSGEYA